MTVDFSKIFSQRHSTRAYKTAQVKRDVVERLLTAARCAPSGANLQPGGFHVLTGQALADLKARLHTAVEDEVPHELEYSYFPPVMSPVLKERQRKAGFALYEALGIARRDVAARRQQFKKNYDFFDAPVGIVVTIDRDMGSGCFMDLGMSIMAFMLAAEAEALGTTGIGALANYGRIVHEHLDLSPDELVVCGLALGFSDETAAINSVRTERQKLSDFASFHGFDGEN